MPSAGKARGHCVLSVGRGVDSSLLVPETKRLPGRVDVIGWVTVVRGPSVPDVVTTEAVPLHVAIRERDVATMVMRVSHRVVLAAEDVEVAPAGSLLGDEHAGGGIRDRGSATRPAEDVGRHAIGDFVAVVFAGGAHECLGALHVFPDESRPGIPVTIAGMVAEA